MKKHKQANTKILSPKIFAWGTHLNSRDPNFILVLWLQTFSADMLKNDTQLGCNISTLENRLV